MCWFNLNFPFIFFLLAFRVLTHTSEKGVRGCPVVNDRKYPSHGMLSFHLCFCTNNTEANTLLLVSRSIFAFNVSTFPTNLLTISFTAPC